MPRLTLLILALLIFGLPARAEPPEPVATQAPPGDYRLDPAHARLLAGVDNRGFSETWLLFRDIEADLRFDPLRPEAMALRVRIDPASVETMDPRFDAVVAGPEFLDAAHFPQAGFISTSVRLTAPDAAAVTGDLTLHGVTRKVTLRARFNLGSPGHPDDPGGARVGFSATGSLFRSDFGIGPAPARDAIGDLVTLRIEAEFINPDASGPQLGP